MSNAIIIPCYNESERLDANSFLNYAQHNPETAFYFYNDGSTDNTAQLLEGFAEKMPNIFAIGKPDNKGKGEALRSAVKYILSLKKDYELIGFIDADLAAPLSQIDLLLEQKNAENLQIIAGSRIKICGKVIVRSRVRHYLGRIFATYHGLFIKLPNYDTQCGLKLFNTQHVAELFKEPFASKWLFDIELFLRAKHILQDDYEQKVKEVPLDIWTEKGGSKIKLSSFLKAPIEIIKIWKKYQ